MEKQKMLYSSAVLSAAMLGLLAGSAIYAEENTEFVEDVNEIKDEKDLTILNTDVTEPETPKIVQTVNSIPQNPESNATAAKSTANLSEDINESVVKTDLKETSASAQSSLESPDKDLLNPSDLDANVSDKTNVLPDGWNEDRTSYISDGKLITGEHLIDGNWYFFDDLGQRFLGQKQINGSWYYFDPANNGTRTSKSFITLTKNVDNTAEDKIVYYDDEGKMVYKQQKIDGNWYCFHQYSGQMFTGMTFLDKDYNPSGEKWVYYDQNGQMLYGLQSIGEDDYYFDPITGARANNKMIASKDNEGKIQYYYYNSQGKKSFGEKKINGDWYYFNPENGGIRVNNKFVTLTKTANNVSTDKTVYYDKDGKMVYKQQKIDGNWYCFDQYSGKMFTGMTHLTKDYNPSGEKWAFYNQQGQMLYGLQYIGGTYYFFDPVTGARANHKMIASKDSEGKIQYHYYDMDGKRSSGEKKINGDWYYFDSANGGVRVNSSFITLTKTANNVSKDKTVYYDQDGKMVYKQKKINGNWYCFDQYSGEMFTGLKHLDKAYQPNGAKTVFYNNDGKMQYGLQSINGQEYYFDTNTGARYENRFLSLNGKKYYYNSNGLKASGELRINGNWYYFDTSNDGAMVTGFKEIPSGNSFKKVYYNADGKMQYGLLKIQNNVYAFDQYSGQMMTGWKTLDSNYTKTGKRTLYFDLTTGAAKSGSCQIDSLWYRFNSDCYLISNAQGFKTKQELDKAPDIPLPGVFTNSSLAPTKFWAHPNNYTVGREGNQITEIVVHHMAGVSTAYNCGYVFIDPNRRGSTHYGVGVDGSICQYVDEANTAYANANWEHNLKAVSIETSNSTMGPSWLVNQKTFDTLCTLVADIAMRNNLGKLVYGVNLLGHRDCCNTTTCPGPYLYPKLPEICQIANRINGFA